MASAGRAARPRRVLIVVQNLPVPFDRRVWLEATTLARAGYQVSVISPKVKGFTASFEELEDVHIYRYGLPVDAQGALGFVAEFLWCFVRTAMKTLLVGGWKRINQPASLEPRAYTRPNGGQLWRRHHQHHRRGDERLRPGLAESGRREPDVVTGAIEHERELADLRQRQARRRRHRRA